MKAGLLAATMVALVPAAAHAVSVSGTSGGMSWTATSNIVGVGSTATVASGGLPIYAATAPKYSGVAALIMNYGSAGSFICSGSLLGDGRSVLTAGHCLAPTQPNAANQQQALQSVTAYFYGGGDPDQVVPLQPQSTAITASQLFVNPDYTGEVIDQNDIAVVRLSQLAPDFAQRYDIYSGNDLTGVDFNVAGYGRRSDTGGTVGANLGTGRLRQGDNRYDFRLGDADFQGFWDGFFGTADTDYTYLSDFDNGLAANDASCRILPGLAPDVIIAPSAKYCNLGRGITEVSTAGGDSGGPQFVNGQISSVTSFGLSFGTNFGDIGGGLNSSFGEFNGFVPTYIHRDFINFAIAVPEPSTWAVMLTGLFGVGGMIRRRKAALAA